MQARMRAAKGKTVSRGTTGGGRSQPTSVASPGGSQPYRTGLASFNAAPRFSTNSTGRPASTSMTGNISSAMSR